MPLANEPTALDTSFIAFKVPMRMKRHLQSVAVREGVNLSQLLRRECVRLLREQNQPSRTGSPSNR